MATNSEIAETIRTQLGGQKFSAMTGIDVKKMAVIENGLRMLLPRNKSRANILQIILTPADEYRIEFRKLVMREGREDVLSSLDGIQVANLRETFTRHTGLETHL